MRLILAGALLALAGGASAQPQNPSMSAAVRKDLQCFIIFSAAAGAAKDEETRGAAGLGTMYYLGRLDISAPGLDLEQAIRRELTAMQGNPATTKMGELCGTEVETRGQSLIDISKALKPQSSSSS